jgi:hypothetical protein
MHAFRHPRATGGAVFKRHSLTWCRRASSLFSVNGKAPFHRYLLAEVDPLTPQARNRQGYAAGRMPADSRSGVGKSTVPRSATASLNSRIELE